MPISRPEGSLPFSCSANSLTSGADREPWDAVNATQRKLNASELDQELCLTKAINKQLLAPAVSGFFRFLSVSGWDRMHPHLHANLHSPTPPHGFQTSQPRPRTYHWRQTLAVPRDSAGGSGYETGSSWPESRSHQELLIPAPSVQTSYLKTQIHLS